MKGGQSHLHGLSYYYLYSSPLLQAIFVTNRQIGRPRKTGAGKQASAGIAGRPSRGKDSLDHLVDGFAVLNQVLRATGRIDQLSRIDIDAQLAIDRREHLLQPDRAILRTLT